MALEIDSITLAAGGILVSGGVAFGIVKGTLSTFIKHSEHREICHEKSKETNEKIDSLIEKVSDLSGFVRGKLGE
jgi:hypothetical protein